MKLTTGALKRIVAEEARKHSFGKPQSTEDAADETIEIDADELASALEKPIDYVKALKLEEQRLTRRLKNIRAQIAERRAVSTRRSTLRTRRSR